MNKNNDIFLITSPANPRVKALRKLRQRSNDDPERFLIVGTHHIGSALEAGWHIEELFITSDVLENPFGKKVIQTILRMAGDVFQIEGALFNELSEKDHDRGMLAVCRKRVFTLDDLVGLERIAALLKPQDPGNAGTILRTLDSVGGGGLVLLDGGIKPYHPSFLRASMGSIFWNPVVMCDFDTLSAWRAVNQYRMIGTSAKGKPSGSHYAAKDRTILLFGSEQKGLEPDQIDACDELVSLPMKGHHSSLNISVAAGILLYKYFAQTD